MNFILSILVMCGVYFAIANGGVLLQRHAHLTSIAYGAILGVGSYLYAVFSSLGLNPLSSLMVAAVGGAILGIILVLVSARSIGQDYALVTFALQITFVSMVRQFPEVTGGVLGISRIPDLPLSTVFGHLVAPLVWIVIVIAVQQGAVIALRKTGFFWSCSIVAKSRELALTLGTPVTVVRATLGVFVGASAGIMGAVFAAYLSYIDPTMFSVGVSVTVLGVIFIGLDGRWWSLAIGVFLLVAVPQLVRLMNISSSRTAHLQMILGGAVLLFGAAIAFHQAPSRGRMQQ